MHQPSMLWPWIWLVPVRNETLPLIWVTFYLWIFYKLSKNVPELLISPLAEVGQVMIIIDAMMWNELKTGSTKLCVRWQSMICCMIGLHFWIVVYQGFRGSVYYQTDFVACCLMNSFILGSFIVSMPWYVGAFIFFCLTYDPKERSRFASCAIASMDHFCANTMFNTNLKLGHCSCTVWKNSMGQRSIISLYGQQLRGFLIDLEAKTIRILVRTWKVFWWVLLVSKNILGFRV
jgi:hypothetical protein